MTRRLEKWYTWGAMGCMMVLGTMVTSCINEDLSDCGWDYEVIYSLQLHTSLQDHIEHCLVEAIESGDMQAIEELNKAIDRFIK